MHQLPLHECVISDVQLNVSDHLVPTKHVRMLQCPFRIHFWLKQYPSRTGRIVEVALVP